MGNWGIKISKEGYDVLEATEQQLAFSSSFPILKATSYGLVLTSGGAAEVTHDLGYRPAFEVWAKASTYRVKLPRYYSGSDPINGAVGFAYVDTTKLYISTTASEVYYYIFVDPIT